MPDHSKGTKPEVGVEISTTPPFVGLKSTFPIRNPFTRSSKQLRILKKNAGRFQALQLDGPPDGESLKYTDECLLRTHAAAFMHLNVHSGYSSQESIKVRAFYFHSSISESDVILELRPVLNLKAPAPESAAEQPTSWALGEDVSAVRAFKSKAPDVSELARLEKQKDLVVRYRERTHSNTRWVVSVPVCEPDTKLRIGVVCLLGTGNTVMRDHLSQVAVMVEPSVVDIGRMWQKMSKKLVSLGVTNWVETWK